MFYFVIDILKRESAELTSEARKSREQQIEWRRTKVLELASEGYNQRYEKALARHSRLTAVFEELNHFAVLYQLALF